MINKSDFEKINQKFSQNNSGSTVKNITKSIEGCSVFTSDTKLNFEIDKKNSIFGDNKNESCNETHECSAALPYSTLGRVIDWLDGETKDGKIDNTKQHKTGDCWLLSGVNALSYTEKGREIIKNALEYDPKKKCTYVHLGGYGTITVSNSEISDTKASSQYSSGDDDMIIFELAIEKLQDKIAKGEVAVDPSAPSYLSDFDIYSEYTRWGYSSTVGGFVNRALYFITGKAGEKISNKEEMKNALLNFEQNLNKDIAMGVSCNKDKTVTDINGQRVDLYGPHAYAVKEVKNGVVTVINPWNSQNELKFDIDTFVNGFDFIDRTDLSDNNPEVNYISTNYTVNEDGSRRFKFENSANEAEIKRTPITGRVISNTVYDSNGEKISSKEWEYGFNLKKLHKEKNKYTNTTYQNGKVTSVNEYEFYGSGSRLTTSSIYNFSTGQVINRTCYKYNADGSYTTSIYNAKGENTEIGDYDKNGNLCKQTLLKHNDNGKVSSSSVYERALNGELVLTSSVEYNPGTQKVLNRTEYKYNADGTSTSYTYNNNNDDCTVKSYNSNGAVICELTYKLDKKSNQYILQNTV